MGKRRLLFAQIVLHTGTTTNGAMNLWKQLNVWKYKQNEIIKAKWAYGHSVWVWYMRRESTGIYLNIGTGN